MDKKPQRIAKENAVASLREKMQNNSTVLLLDYKGITVNAVSYTHLDVYKRQLLWRRSPLAGAQC